MRFFRFAALAALMAFSLFAGTARAVINNPISLYPVDTDGHYGTPANPNEWTDITPAWFISSGSSGATPTFAGDPNANSLLYAGLAKDTPSSPPELYLMYDYLARTRAPTAGEFLGNVSFPLTTSSGTKNITVVVHANATTPLTGPGQFTVDLNDGQGAIHNVSEFGIEGAVNVGTTPSSIVGASSPFHTTFHELIELGVPLLIGANFGTSAGTANAFPGGLPGDGHGNGYSPDPAFWSSGLAKNDSDPPASGGMFTINPNGTTGIVPMPVPVPEPSTFVLGALGAMGLWGVARKQRGLKCTAKARPDASIGIKHRNFDL